MQISPWRQHLQKKWSIPQRSQRKMQQNCQFRILIFETLSQRFFYWKFVIFQKFKKLKNLKNGQLKSEKSLWQNSENQKSELTVLLHFLLATSWYTSFFLEVLYLGRNLRNKIAYFEIFQKITKTPTLWCKLHPLECISEISFSFYLVAFSVGYVVVYFNFSVGVVFVEQFTKQNCLFSDFLPKFCPHPKSFL